MRRYRNVAILVVVLALLGGTYFILSKKPDSNKTDAPTDTTIKLLELDKEKISDMTIVHGDNKFVITKKDKEWVLTTPSGINYDKIKVDNLVSVGADFSADRLVEENATDLSKYGLDKSTTVTLKMDDGSTRVLEIGNRTQTNDGYYIKMKDNSKVYVAGTFVCEAFKLELKEIRNKTVFDLKPEDVIGFTLEKGTNLVFTSKKQGDAKWTLTAPFEANVDSAKLGLVLNTITGLSILDFVEKNPSDISKYGLKAPAYAIEVETSTGKTKLLIGDEKKKGEEFYAMIANTAEVVVIGQDTLNFLDKPLKEIVESFAYIVNIEDVNKITVEIDGKTDTFDLQVTDKSKKDNKETDKFFVNGKDLKDAKLGDKTGDKLFREYYQSLIGVTLSEIEIGAKPTVKPEVVFTYYLKKAPGTMKVEFVSKDDKYYYVVKNGVYSNIIVSKDQFKQVRDCYKNLIDSLNSK